MTAKKFIICDCCEVANVETSKITKASFFVCDSCREYCKHLDFKVKKNNIRPVIDTGKIDIKLNYLSQKMWVKCFDNARATELISDLFVNIFNDIAMIKKTTQRKVYIKLCAQYHNTTNAIALEKIEDNGLFIALPITNKLITIIKDYLKTL
jgi:hypothetical protein